MIFLWLALGCLPKEVPPHLRVDTVQEEQAAAPVTTDAEALRALVGRDPLGRLALPGESGDWSHLPSGEGLEAWAKLARDPSTSAQAWQDLESSWSGSLIVGLSRGAQLGRLEALLAGSRDQGLGPDAIGWLGPIQIGEQLYPRAPGAWLGVAPLDERAVALATMERAVLLGWLASPEVPLAAVADSLTPAVHGRLLASPAGSVLVARAEGPTDPESASLGRALLERATTLALQEVAADADGEQQRWREVLPSLREELGSEDPIGKLLEDAVAPLLLDAGTKESTGMALVATTAQRLRNSCPDSPCVGLDRTRTLKQAQAWGPETKATAQTWILIALKSSVDAFEASWDHPSFKTHAPLLADALLGTGASSIDQGVLRVSTATQGTFLSLGRAAGKDGVTDLDGTRRALRARLADVAQLTLAEELPDEQRALVERILRRAQKAP